MPGARAAVLTVSDGVSAGTREDLSGQEVASLLSQSDVEVIARKVVPDDLDAIEEAIRELASVADLVITTGGTGFGPRDVTPEATRRVLEREAPGLMHLMLDAGIRHTPMAALSRSMAGAVGRTLVVNLPGSPRGARENLEAVLPVIGHAVRLLAGDTEHR